MSGAVRGLETGGVAVKGKDRFGRGAPKQFKLVGGERGAQRRHGMGEAGPHQRDHIHIAFAQNDGPRLDRGGPGGVEIVEIEAREKSVICRY